MAGDLGILQDLLTGYLPLAPGIQSQRVTGFEGVPGLGGGLGMPWDILGMAAQPKVREWMGGLGMMPLGLGHDQNAYDLMHRMQFQQQQMQAIQRASIADQDSHFRTFRGVAAAFGQPFGPEQRQAAMSAASALSSASPFLVQFAPEFMDKLGGQAGSAAVMAKHLVDAGRYRIDPSTGRYGLSAEVAGRQAGDLFRELWAPDQIAKMKGMKAGEAGELLGELQSRGLVAGGKFGGDDQVTALARDKDSMKTAIKGYADAVAAMREIFGDAGHPDAPMRQLVAGLEAMTAGASAQVSPQNLARSVRETYALAKQSGVPIGNALLIQQHAAVAASNVGIEGAFSVPVTQQALAFGQAYRAMGLNQYTAWGAMTADQLVQLRANQATGAAASNASNNVGALTRMAAGVGGFKPGSPADRLLEATRRGEDQVIHEGRTYSIAMSGQEFSRMAQASGTASGAPIDPRTFATLAQDRAANRETVFADPQVQNAITARQRREIGGVAVQTLFTELVQNKGLTRVEAGAAAEEAGRAYITMDRKTFSTHAARREEGIKLLQTSLRNTDLGRELAALPEGQRKSRLGQILDRFESNADQAYLNGPYGVKNRQQANQGQQDSVWKAEDQARLQAHSTSRFREALSGLVRGGMVEGAIAGLQDAKPGDPKAGQKILARMMGGVDIGEAGHRLAPELTALQLTFAAAQVSAKPAQFEALKAAADQLVGKMRAMGLEGPAPAEAAKAGSQDAEHLARKLVQSHAIMTGAFDSVTDAERDAFRKSSAVLSPEDAGAVLTVQRLDVVRQLRADPSKATEVERQRLETVRGEIVLARNKAGQPELSAADLTAQALDQLERSARSPAGTKGEIDRLDRIRDSGPAGLTNPEADAAIAARRRRGVHESVDVTARRSAGLEDAAFVSPDALKAARGRLRDAWQTDEGADFRLSVSAFLKSGDSAGAALLANPEAMAAASQKTLADHTELRQSQNELALLAGQVAGGDIARLLQGDLDVEQSDPARYRKAYRRGQELVERQRALLNQLQSPQAGSEATDVDRHRLKMLLADDPERQAQASAKALGLAGDGKGLAEVVASQGGLAFLTAAERAQAVLFGDSFEGGPGGLGRARKTPASKDTIVREARTMSEEEFRATYGGLSEERYHQAKTAAEMLHRAGADTAGSTAANVADAYRKDQQRELGQAAAARAGAPAGPMKIEGTLTIDLVKSLGHIVAGLTRGTAHAGDP